MAITLGFNLAGNAQSAAQQFINLINDTGSAVVKMSEAMRQFDADGNVMSQTFKAITSNGSTLNATLRQTAQGFELMAAKSDEATASLRALEAQEKAAQAAFRKQEANSAEGMLGNLKGLQPGGNANQVNAAEAAMQRIRQAIESGSVSLARFQQLYNQVTSNPKAIIPNLTEQEQQVVRSLRTMTEGFDKTGDKAQRTAERISISWQGLLRLFQAQVIKRITGGLESSFAEGVQSAVDFSVRIAEIQTISQKAGLTTEQWASGVRQLSSAFGASQSDIAEGAYQAISNQVTKGAETFEFLNTALRFGKSTVTSTADSVNLLSSAMKSFNIPTSNAERVAGIFFKTIELGRVRGNEMADTFGRIGTIANDAGIKLEEVSAAIATLTVKGMKFSDASTLISNVIIKLLRPTDAMKDLFAEWGVASGQAAIATYGFEGVLKRLDVEAEKGSNRLGDLFNQIRAFRGVTNLTGNTFGDFQKNLGEITQGQGEFDKAVDIVMESFGDRVRKQLNQVKVYFSEEFGDGIIQAFVKISEGAGGAANVLAKVEAVLKPLLAVWLGWKAATTATAAVQAILTLALNQQTTATVANTVATSVNAGAHSTQAAAAASAVTPTLTLAGAMNTLNAALGPFSAAFTLGMLYFNAEDEARIENVTKNLEKQANLKFDTFKTFDTSSNGFKDDINRTQENFATKYKIVLQYQANNIKASDIVKKNAIQNLREVTEQTKVSSKTYFDAIAQGMKNLRDSAAEAKSMIEQSLKSSEQTERKMTDSLFQNKLKFAGDGYLGGGGLVIDEQKTTLIKNRIEEIQALARSKFKEGTKESVDDARKLYDEIQKLTNEQFDLEQKKRRTEFDAAVKMGRIAPSGFSLDPQTGEMRARYDFTVKTAELEERLIEISNEKLRAEKRLRAEKEQQLKIAQDTELREKARVKAIQQAISEIEKIKVLDDRGEATGRFADDPKAALAEFDRQAAIARKAASQLEVRDRLQTLDFLAKQREALEREVNARILSERARTEQETTQMQAKKTKDRLVEIEKSYDSSVSRMANDSKRIDVALGKFGSGDFKLGARDKNMFGTDLGAATTRAFILEDGLEDLKNKAKEANEEFARNKTEENFTKAKIALDQFIVQYRKYIEATAGDKIGNLPADTPGLSKLEELLKERNDLAAAKEQQEKAESDLYKIEGAGNRMKNSISGIPGVWRLIDQIIGDVTPSITTNIETLISRTDSLLTKVKATADAIRQLGGNPDPPPNDLPRGFFGNQPRTYAYGGRGSDNQLAYINSNERVMTGQAEANWSPLLQAMNAGMTPTQMSGGNRVTNVGDINITMPSGTSDQSVRTFAKSLRRAIRRGTTTLE